MYKIHIPKAHSVWDTRLNYVPIGTENEVLGRPEPLQNCNFPQNEACLIPPVVLRIPRDRPLYLISTSGGGPVIPKIPPPFLLIDYQRSNTTQTLHRYTVSWAEKNQPGFFAKPCLKLKKTKVLLLTLILTNYAPHVLVMVSPRSHLVAL